MVKNICTSKAGKSAMAYYVGHDKMTGFGDIFAALGLRMEREIKGEATKMKKNNQHLRDYFLFLFDIIFFILIKSASFQRWRFEKIDFDIFIDPGLLQWFLAVPN
jgi:hypothetical protein